MIQCIASCRTDGRVHGLTSVTAQLISDRYVSVLPRGIVFPFVVSLILLLFSPSRTGLASTRSVPQPIGVTAPVQPAVLIPVDVTATAAGYREARPAIVGTAISVVGGAIVRTVRPIRITICAVVRIIGAGAVTRIISAVVPRVSCILVRASPENHSCTSQPK